MKCKRCDKETEGDKLFCDLECLKLYYAVPKVGVEGPWCSLCDGRAVGCNRCRGTGKETP